VRAVDELIDSIVNSSEIPSAKRREIQRELRSHIEDFVVAAREADRPRDEIEKLLIEKFGDPRQIAQAFAWVYRHERRTLRALAYTLSTVFLAGSLSAAILVMQAGLVFSFGTSATNMLAGRHVLIEMLDILTSVAAYLALISFENLFECHRFQKAAFLLAGIVAALVMSCAAAGLPQKFLLFGLVNGVFFRALQLFVTPKIVRAGIVVICFPLAGLAMALQRAPVSPLVLATTCASWLIMGAGYQLMTHLAERVDRALLNGLQRIQAGY